MSYESVISHAMCARYDWLAYSVVLDSLDVSWLLSSDLCSLLGHTDQ